MATVVVSPLPAGELGPLEPLIAAVGFQWKARLAVTVLIFYDYLLTLDEEIEYIWKRSSWRSSTVLYVFIRYFGTLYNLTATTLMLLPRTDQICQFIFGSEAWAGSIIWWAVQVVLQLRLYALYGRSKKLLVLMMTLFAAEVGSMLWILIGTSLLRSGTLAEHVYITGYYYSDVEVCIGETIPAYNHIWIACFTFDAVLALLAVWAGVQQSRQQSHAQSRFNKSRLVNILIHGNVVYFLSPLLVFILFLANVNLKVQWFADTLLFRVPITISAGCRLVLSVGRATASSSKQYSSISTWGVSSTAVPESSISQGP